MSRGSLTSGSEDGEDPKKELHEQWAAFKANIRDVYSDFDQFYWMRALTRSAIKYILHIARLIRLLRFIRRNRGYFIHFMPVFGISLVMLSLTSYLYVLHDEITVNRFCTCQSADLLHNERSHECLLSMLIKVVAYYLVFMINYNYMQTTFTSPGVLLPNKIDKKVTWRSVDGRGGCIFINPTFDKEKENNLVQMFQRSSKSEVHSPNDGTVFIPSTLSSYCNKCEMNRPPRCHHCSHCNRCILQMDHHCIWINNCIGYNNHRTFFLTLIYLVMGCWYGVAILSYPFYEAIRDQLNSDGLHMIFNILLPFMMIQNFTSQSRFEPVLLIKLLFPFLLFNGILLTSFMCTHLSYMKQGVTTLERMIMLRFAGAQANMDSIQVGRMQTTKSTTIHNPFDQGIYGNISQTLGRNIFWSLLPIKVKPENPYFPSKLKGE